MFRKMMINWKTIAVSTLATILIGSILVNLSACDVSNYQMVDTVYNYKYAWIDIPGGNVVEGEVMGWKDFEDGDQIQVKINGHWYLTDTTRCVLKD